MDASDQARETEEIFSFLSRHPVGTISTVSKENTPSGAIVYLCAHSDLTCFFATRINTQKCRDIMEQPSVALTVADDRTLEIVQMRGEAVILTDADEVRDAMESLRKIAGKEKQRWMAHPDAVAGGVYGIDVSRWVPPIAQLGSEASVFIKITPHWTRFRRYDSDWKTGEKYTEYIISK